MRRANGLKCKTVAFSLLSAGNRLGRQSLDNVLTVAVKAIGDMAYPGLQRVHLVAHSSTEQEALQRVLSLATARAVDGAFPPRATSSPPAGGATSSPPPGGPASPAPSRSPPQRQSSRAILANRVVTVSYTHLTLPTILLV